ncbi:MAG: GTP-binding protein [Methylococcaceae bacterium NSP1-2]|nr:GTP-binding protein TypA [Methylococcaceae bacterium]OYV18167.1 MAG: GTP-binding protein [Methylococcaceae bacterium NSP1-2]
MIEKLRNIAIIAHVDHGKTTLVDKLLQQSGTFAAHTKVTERMMDSNDIEKERGITILAKNTALDWNGYHINIVDTPGHADFGGEVERVLSMVDSVLLLVDAVDGPMPQTRFVTQKAFALGLKPIVVINKIDRPGARPDWVVDQTFDLFDRLGATDEQLDFPIVFASAINGYAGLDSSVSGGDMTPLFQTIVDKVSPPPVNIDGPFQMQVISLDYNTYTGVIGIGRIQRGIVKPNQPLVIVNREGVERKCRMLQVFGFHGLERVEVQEARAGDIIAFAGIEKLEISDTICSPECIETLPPLTVDEPTVSMTFQVNNSPFAGKEGKFVTTRQIRDRLEKELQHNVALHLSVLIENMRREGFEMGVSRPEVILKEIDGKKCEPFEMVTVEVEEEHQGSIMEKLGERKGDLTNMVPDGKGRIRLEYMMPSRGLIGFQTEFMTATSGSGLLYHVFDHYGPMKAGEVGNRMRGVMISMVAGKAVTYSLHPLQERGELLLVNGDEVYEGMLVGLHSRTNDLCVNPCKPKQLTNVRASGTDESLVLARIQKLTLEQALEFIAEDELVEVTPKSIRLRKKFLTENERKRAAKS